MKVALIVAMDRERGIGKNNDLMWHLPNDMRFFKDTTLGNIVVMGRKNYESIPEKFRPLPNRENVVLTRNLDYNAPNCKVFNALEACFEFYKNEKERTLYIIGGGEIYAQVLQTNRVEEMYITFVDGVYQADTYFPVFDENEWEKYPILSQNKDEKHANGFEIIKFIRKK